MKALIVASCLVASTAFCQADMFKPSSDQQIKLGKEAAADIRKKEKVLPSSDSKVKLLRKVGQSILNAMEGKLPWEFSFDVIDSKEVNAFALPGGSTYFYTGILNKMKTEDELAAVLGHELTHVLREHWARHVADSQKRGLGLSILVSLTRLNSSVSNGIGLLNNLYDLKYSRGDEFEADDGGYKLMVKAGYNPKGMADVFRMLKTSGGEKPSGVLSGLSTHPTDDSRIKRVEDRMAKDGKTFPAEKPLAWAKS